MWSPSSAGLNSPDYYRRLHDAKVSLKVATTDMMDNINENNHIKTTFRSLSKMTVFYIGNIYKYRKTLFNKNNVFLYF